MTLKMSGVPSFLRPSAKRIRVYRWYVGLICRQSRSSMRSALLYLWSLDYLVVKLYRSCLYWNSLAFTALWLSSFSADKFQQWPWIPRHPGVISKNITEMVAINFFWVLVYECTVLFYEGDTTLVDFVGRFRCFFAIAVGSSSRHAWVLTYIIHSCHGKPESSVRLVFILGYVRLGSFDFYSQTDVSFSFKTMFNLSSGPERHGANLFLALHRNERDSHSGM